MKSKKNSLVARRALWESDPGHFIIGRDCINAVDQLTNELNAKWGRGRLRLLANPELRGKFDRQWELWNSAVWYGTLEEIQLQAERMQKALRALERSAVEGGHPVVEPPNWSITLSDGRVLHMVREVRDSWAIQPAGVVWSLEEVARLIEAQDAITQALKGTFVNSEILEKLPEREFTEDDPEDIR